MRNKIAVLLGLCLVLAFSVSLMADHHLHTGWITDAKCGAKHVKNSTKSSAECAKACVHGGAKYTLVDGDKIYTLEGKEDQLDRVAGERATVEGTVDGNVIKVASVSSGNAN